MSESLLARAKRRALEEGIVVRDEPILTAPMFDDDLIPDLGVTKYERTQQDIDIDSLLDGVDIVNGYRKWCGKMEPKVGSKRESIMVSCPNPTHPDEDPSAWVNLDKQTWFCGGCQQGGDKYDIAAWHFGYDVPGYKRNGFPALRRDMAQDLGYYVARTSNGDVAVKASEGEGEPDGDDSEGHSLAPVIQLGVAPQPAPATVRIDWEAIVPADTFLDRWMRVCSVDDLPEEFYFWMGLLAVGFAAGDDAVLRDNPMVKANMFVTLYGPTGIGKTRATRALVELLEGALPYDSNDPISTGVAHIASPGSGEALLDNFSKPIYDPTDPKKVVGYSQVRGLFRMDELSDLIGRASRTGSVMKPMLMRLYDAYGNVDHRARGTGYVRAERPFCSTVVGTQPRAIRDLLMQSDADSGFVNRWVFAMGEPKKLVAIDREPLDIDSCIQPLQGLRGWAAVRRLVELDDGAKTVWREFFEDTIEPIKLSGEESLLTRSDLTLKKLMLLFAINEKSMVVTADIVERVLQLWDYLRDTYASLSAEIGVGEFEDCRYRVMEFIRSWEDEHQIAVTSRDISRLMPRRYTRKLIHEVLNNLREMGEVNEEYLHGQKGRPGSARYRIASA